MQIRDVYHGTNGDNILEGVALPGKSNRGREAKFDPEILRTTGFVPSATAFGCFVHARPASHLTNASRVLPSRLFQNPATCAAPHTLRILNVSDGQTAAQRPFPRCS